MKEATFYKTFSFNLPEKAFSILPTRPERSGKWDYGRVLCICGSRGMAGAALLCAKAAYRTGAGLVEILTDDSNRVILQMALPEAVLSVYHSVPDEAMLHAAISRSDVVVCGCGIGISGSSRKLLSDVLHTVHSLGKPILLDADALNLLCLNPSLLKYTRGAVITPHVREMSRLTGTEVEEILSSPADVAYRFAQKHGVICVLKDHRTPVSDGGNELYINTTGNSGMATAGSGDVLSGIISGLMAQKGNSSASLFETVCLGVYLHGLCGDIAAERLSKYSLMASDIIDALPEAIKRMGTRR